MTEHVIRRGLDIPIVGAATGELVAVDLPERVVIDPREFRGIVPRLIARAGDIVAQGAPLFHAKSDANLVYRSPVAGTVVDIERGYRRVITGIVIAPAVDGGSAIDVPTATADQITAMSRGELTERLCASGLWWSLRQRPLDRVALPGEVPQAILVCGTETGPLQPGPDILLSKDPAWFRLGLVVLRGLTDGAVHVTTPSGSSHPAFQGLAGVQVHAFRGPHPSGDPVVQVNHVCPPRGNGRVWYLHAWEVERIGRAFATGRYPADKICAAVGAGVTAPRFVKTVIGAPLSSIAGAVRPGEARWILGSVLTGVTSAPESGVGWYVSAVHVLPADVPRRLFGWMMPAFGEYSAHRAFLRGWLKPSSGRDLRPGIYGGHRGLVPVDQYRRVVSTPDIEPEFLMKALAAGNLEEAITLGLLDLSPEEAALCTYICPSKIEFDQLLRKGLDMYEREN